MAQTSVTFCSIENTQAFLYLLIPSQNICYLDVEKYVYDSGIFIKIIKNIL